MSAESGADGPTLPPDGSGGDPVPSSPPDASGGATPQNAGGAPTDGGATPEAGGATDGGAAAAPDATPEASVPEPDSAVHADAGPLPEASAPETAPDPCAACAPTAVCDPAAATPCTCPAGYTGDGLTCERVWCEPLEGQAAPCGDNTTCREATGSARCVCKSGHGTCDGESPVQACETPLTDNPRHCGKCDRSCVGAMACVEGECARRVVEITGGVTASCARISTSPGAPEGQVTCWGSNAYYGLADYPLPTTEQRLAPGTIVHRDPVRDVASSATHSCSLLALSDTVHCWGLSVAAMGLTSTPSTPGNATDTLVPGAAEVAVASHGTCARLLNGNVRCRGTGHFLGSTTADQASFVTMTGVTDVIELRAGPGGFCGVHQADRSATCWGPQFQQRPQVLADTSSTPLANIVSIAIGQSHHCAALRDGSVWCAGSTNHFGQQGHGDTEPRALLTRVDGISGVAELAAGDHHTCARTTGGAVYCWGRTDSGQTGLGPAGGENVPYYGGYARGVLRPTRVPGLSGAVHIDASSLRTFVLTDTGAVWAFGDNSTGALGDSTTVQRASPVELPMLYPTGATSN